MAEYKRITARSENNVPYLACESVGCETCDDKCGVCPVEDVATERLAVYEDMFERWGLDNMSIEELDKWRDRMIWHVKKVQEWEPAVRLGMTPERAVELGKADAEGRIVVLPCKVGTEVYYITTTCEGCKYEGDDLCPAEKNDYDIIDFICGKPHIASIPYRLGMKADVYLRRPEAEAELERGKKDGSHN